MGTDPASGSTDWVEVTDPAHPLYGRRFEILSAPRGRDDHAHLLVRYRDGIVLRLPRRVTSLSALGHDAPRATLSRTGVEEFLSLVKEYESCPSRIRKSPLAKSGTRWRPKIGKKSSKN